MPPENRRTLNRQLQLEKMSKTLEEAKRAVKTGRVSGMWILLFDGGGLSLVRSGDVDVKEIVFASEVMKRQAFASVEPDKPEDADYMVRRLKDQEEK